MREKDAVRRLLDLGIMVTPEAIQKVKESGIDGFLDEHRGKGCVVAGGDADRLVYCIEEAPRPTELKPEDIIKANANKFEIIRDMILRRMHAVSINNLGGNSSSTSIVGMVR